MSETPVRAEPHERAHPGPKEYVKVAIVLAAITAIEVAVVYIEALKPVLVPMLLTMSAFKFALVVLWFMHLRFDSPLFRRLFLIGLSLAILLFVIVLVALDAFGVLTLLIALGVTGLLVLALFMR